MSQTKMKVQRTLTKGETKNYEYKTIGGISVSQYIIIYE